MASDADPYARIAAAYDAEFSGAEADIAGYASRGLAGPVLVLGCGTGRVCRGLAALRPVTGLDRSAPMIHRARSTSPASVDYVVGDMTSFDLGPFAEVVIPNASFSFLADRRSRAACLAACRRALGSGGPLTIDLPMPDYSLLGTPHTPERPAWGGEMDGRRVTRTREVFREPVAGRIRLLDRYVFDDEDPILSELVLHLHTLDEVEWMLEANGFYVDAAWGDHAGGPVREGCDRLLVRALPL